MFGCGLRRDCRNGGNHCRNGGESEIAATGIKNFMLSLTAGNLPPNRRKKRFACCALTRKNCGGYAERRPWGHAARTGFSGEVPKEKQAAVLNALFGKESLEPLRRCSRIWICCEPILIVCGCAAVWRLNAERICRPCRDAENQLLLLQNQINAISSTLGKPSCLHSMKA